MSFGASGLCVDHPSVGVAGITLTASIHSHACQVRQSALAKCGCRLAGCRSQGLAAMVRCAASEGHPILACAGDVHHSLRCYSSASIAVQAWCRCVESPLEILQSNSLFLSVHQLAIHSNLYVV